jgi:hypothetical protein
VDDVGSDSTRTCRSMRRVGKLLWWLGRAHDDDDDDRLSIIIKSE